MAFFTNNRNVGLCAFIKNDEILLLNPEITDFKADHHKSKLKCSTEISTEVSKQPLSEKTVDVESKQIYITSVAVSNCNNFVAACNSKNSLILWNKNEMAWNITSIRPLARKCQKVIFTNSVSDIILADRGGDVFSFSVSGSEKPGKFLLGHICLILDLTISKNDEFLATCDRDGKIRVSCYPNSYNIVSYCLGHQEFVSSIQFVILETEEVLLSTSGDGTFRLWRDFKNGSSTHFTVYLHENEYLCRDLNVNEESADQLHEKFESQIGSGNLVLGEKHILFSVRNVKYTTKYRLLAVIFHLQPGIAIYKLCDDNQSFEYRQFVCVDSPLDAVFTTNGNLYVISNRDINHLLYLEYEPSSETFCSHEVGIPNIFQQVQEFYKDFQNIAFQEDFISLFKRVYDDLNSGKECNESRAKKIKE